MFWFGGGLFYANAAFFAEHARKLVQQSPTRVRWLAIDARAVTELDFTAGCALLELHQDLTSSGVALALIVVPVRQQGILKRMGLMELIGANRI
jgi:MFS superfamily sulfate permease-like transporter